MPWYYAGPDAQPVGPLSLEELQRRRAKGGISPETYVIEHTGAADPNRAWKPYRELFPAAPAVDLPPFPPAPIPPAAPLPASTLSPSAGYTYPPAPAVASTPVPLPVPGSTRFSGYPDATLRPGQPSGRTTNSACRWGMTLGFLSLPGLVCVVGPLLAVFGLVLSLVGFFQVQARRDQTGRGLAVAGALCSTLTLLITFAVVATFYYHSNFSFQTQTTTETTNSDTQ